EGIPLRLVPVVAVRMRFRQRLARIYRQARLSGRGDALLYRRYRAAGMPRRSIGDGLRDWLRLIQRLPHIRAKSDWARWVRRLGQRVGRLEGSLRYRVIHL